MREEPSTTSEKWLISTVEKQANIVGIKMPEVGIFNSSTPNAFATGASKNSSLVAVSSGLLDAMDQDEIEAVVGHEMAHILNGDMVTMALIQGVINSFVFFFAKIAAWGIANFLKNHIKFLKSSKRIKLNPIYF